MTTHTGLQQVTNILPDGCTHKGFNRLPTSYPDNGTHRGFNRLPTSYLDNHKPSYLWTKVNHHLRDHVLTWTSGKRGDVQDNSSDAHVRQPGN